MIIRITGLLEEVTEHRAVVRPGSGEGLAYELLLPAYLAKQLNAAIGGRITLHTTQYLESQGQGSSFIPRLLGFASPAEREFFDLLTTVKGLGPKRALRAMAAAPREIAQSIADRDHRALQRLPEIGPKLAELLVHELKSKADKFVLAFATSTELVVEVGSTNDADSSTHGRSGDSVGTSVVELKTTPVPTASSNGSAGASKPKRGTGKGDKAEPPRPPIRQTVDGLIALGEAPADAERMVARALDRCRSNGEAPPLDAGKLMMAAYAARS